MSTAAIRRRLKRLEARRSGSAPEVPPTAAERATRFLRIKHIQDSERFGRLYGPEYLPKPFDWDATFERVRRLMIEGGGDPDARY